MRKTIYHATYRALIADLHHARRQSGLTQAQAGRRVQASRNWLSKIERCELRLDVLHFVLLSEVYNVKPEELVRNMAADVRSSKELLESHSSPAPS